MLSDSQMFHISARESLCEIVLDSSSDSETKKRLIHFLTKEATDYQIMSLLVDEQLPLNESDFSHEIYIYEMFHAIVESNRDFLEEWMGADFVDSLKKVRPKNIRVFQEQGKGELSAAAQRQQAGAADRYMNYLKQVYVRNPEEYKKMQPRVWAKLPADKKKEFSSWAKEKAPAMRKQVVAQQQAGGPQVKMGPPEKPEQGAAQQQEPQQQVTPQQQAQTVEPQQVTQQQQAQQAEPQAGGVGSAVKGAASTALAADATIRKGKRIKKGAEKAVELGGKTKEKLKDVDVQQTAQDVSKKAGEVKGAVQQTAQDVTQKGKEAVATTQGAAKQAVEKGKDIIYGKKTGEIEPGTGAQGREGGLVKKGEELAQKVKGSEAYKKGEEYVQQAGEKAKELSGKAAEKVLGKKLVKGGTGEVSRSGGLLQKAQQVAQPAASAAKQAALSTMGAFKTAAAKGGVSAGLKAAALTPGGLAVSGAMLGGLVGFGAWKMYQRFLSAAARNCRQYSGRQKTMCMNKYKIDGLNRQIVELQRGLQACERTKNQIKCKNSIGKKIQRVRQKIAKIQGRG